MTRETMERMVGGAVEIRLVMPASYGKPPEWEAQLTNFPTLPAVRFWAYDDGGDALHKPACEALLKMQSENCPD